MSRGERREIASIAPLLHTSTCHWGKRITGAYRKSPGTAQAATIANPQTHTYSRTVSLVVYERRRAGHRENYAKTVASVLGGEPAIGDEPELLRKSLGARELVITTLESAPVLYTALCLARAAIGRRTSVIATRSHVEAPRGVVRRTGRAGVYQLLRTLPQVQLLTISPPFGAPDPRMEFIEDIEFWDLPDDLLARPPETALSLRVRELRKTRPTLVLLGTIDTIKGHEFLRDLLLAEPRLRDRYAIVACGEVQPGSRSALAPLRELAAVWEDRFITDEELLSLYPEADLVWCCYRPDYDVSSGVFGRAVQFGRPTVVRAGSLVGRLQSALGKGLALTYGDVGEAAVLADADTTPALVSPRHEAGRTALRQIIGKHLHHPRGG